jgi:signal peptidase II
MAFGYDPGSDFKLWISVFSLVASAALLGYLYYMRNHHLSMRIGLAFILGGAAGNMIDRIFYGVFYGYAPLFYGKVVDFFDFDFFNVTIFGRSYDRFPVFNIADAAVTIGVLIMIIFYKKQKTVEIEPAPAAETFDGGRPLIGDSGTVEGIKDSDDDEPDNGKEIPV